MAPLPSAGPGGRAAVIIATLEKATVVQAEPFPEWQDEAKPPPA
jgi:hypothetical protein